MTISHDDDNASQYWIDLTRKKPDNHIWRAFVQRAFVGTKPEDELDDLFG